MHDYREQVRKLNVQLVIDQDEMDALRERIQATTTDLDRLVIAQCLFAWVNECVRACVRVCLVRV